MGLAGDYPALPNHDLAYASLQEAHHPPKAPERRQGPFRLQSLRSDQSNGFSKPDASCLCLIISHIDVVRDMVDTIITIDRKDDFSYIKWVNMLTLKHHSFQL